jgi:manganese oxidase
VRLHLLAAGGDLDIHTPHWHARLGVANTREGTRVAAMDLYPGSTRTVDVTLDTRGAYLVECGTNDHWAAGMRALLLAE